MIVTLSDLSNEISRILPKDIEKKEKFDTGYIGTSYIELSNSRMEREARVSVMLYRYLQVELESRGRPEKKFLYLLKRSKSLSLAEHIVGFLLHQERIEDFPKSETKGAPPQDFKDFFFVNNRRKHHPISKYFVSCSFDDKNLYIFEEALGSPDSRGLQGGMNLWYFDNENQVSIAIDKIEYYKAELKKKEARMKKIIIEKDLEIPGTNIVLEKGDRVLYKEMNYNLERTLANDGWNDDGDGFYWHEKGFGLLIDERKNYVEITTGEDYEKVLWKGTIEQFENEYEMGSNLYMGGKKLRAR